MDTSHEFPEVNTRKKQRKKKARITDSVPVMFALLMTFAGNDDHYFLPLTKESPRYSVSPIDFLLPAFY